jgi:transcriptional regulator with XRE-family HTH domain
MHRRAPFPLFIARRRSRVFSLVCRHTRSFVMASDGTPERAAIRCGEAIARLRTKRRWTRTQLLTRLLREMTPTDPYYESASETWLARLENGRMVKVPRATVEALCRALRCSPRERAWVLLHADRNVLADTAGAPTPAAELLTFVVERLYVETGDSLNALLTAREATASSELELFEIAAAALEQALARRRRAAANMAAASMTGSRHRGAGVAAAQRVS